MKKTWIILGIVLVLLGVGIYLYYSGIIEWEFLAVIAAALAVPFKFLKNIFGGKKKEQEIIDSHKNVREQETKYQEDLKDRRDERTEKIEVLENEIKITDEELKDLEIKKDAIDKEVDDMSVDELKQAGKDEFGD